MIYETLEISALGHTAQLVVYGTDNFPAIDPARTRPAVVICPGGGYGATSDREAEAVALRFVAMGIQAAVLRYSVAPAARFPVALAQLATAVALVRKNCEKWHVDPDNLSVLGFSAGGHLAASLGVFWNRALLLDELPALSAEDIRPSKLVLCYPVISAGACRHAGSFQNLLGQRAGEAKWMEQVSLEKQVSADTPPTFLWHTAPDDAVPSENSLLFALALAARHIPYELHVYPKGGHGLSLCDEETLSADGAYGIEPVCQGWEALAGRWMKAG